MILLYDWYWADILLTLLITGYVLYQAATLLPKTIHILMEGAPENISLEDVIDVMEQWKVYQTSITLISGNLMNIKTLWRPMWSLLTLVKQNK